VTPSSGGQMGSSGDVAAPPACTQWILRFRHNSDDATEIIGYHPVLWRGTECKVQLMLLSKGARRQLVVKGHDRLTIVVTCYRKWPAWTLSGCAEAAPPNHSLPHPDAQTDGVRRLEQGTPGFWLFVRDEVRTPWSSPSRRSQQSFSEGTPANSRTGSGFARDMMIARYGVTRLERSTRNP
jgi:hypothetical protein